MAVAWEFNRGLDGLTVAASPNSGTRDWSASFWLYAETPADQDVILIMHGGTAAEYLNTLSSGTIRLRQGNITGSPVTYPAFGQWAHIAIKRGGTSNNWWYCWVDGVQIANGGWAGVPVAHTDFAVGESSFALPAGTSGLGGKIAFLKVWSAAIPDAALLAERYTRRAVYRTDLWAEFPRIGGSAIMRADTSGNGNDLSEDGSPTIVDDHPPIPCGEDDGSAGYLNAAAGASGTFATSLPVPTMSATGIAATAGAFATTLPLPTMSATGTAVTAISGTFTTNLPIPSMSAAGTAKHVGEFAVTLPLLTMSASGSVSQNVTGTFAATLPLPDLNASGSVSGAVSGAFAGTLPLPTMSAAGTAKHTGEFSIDLPVPVLDASGSAITAITGTFAATLPVPTMSATGAAGAGAFGTFSTSLPMPVARLFGVTAAGSALFTGADANLTIGNLRLKIELIQSVSGIQGSPRTLSQREVSSIQINQPIRLPTPRSVDQDLAPLKFRVTVLSGDVTVLRNAIMTIRYRRGN